MKKQLLFVGSTFGISSSLEHYVIRHVKSKVDKLDMINYFHESDKGLFLHLEQTLQNNTNLIIITTQNSFTVIGKFLCTITADNLVLTNKMLIPSRTISYDKDSYIISYNNLTINVMLAQENKILPVVLFEESEKNHILHIFDEQISTLQEQLKPIAFSHDVRLSFSQTVDGWIQVRIHSNRFGNIERFLSITQNIYKNRSISTPNIITHIIKQLQTHNKKVTFAESCTGGLLSYFFTRESGVSNIFDGSLVTYSNILKTNWLAVDDKNLLKYGAVSAEIVEEMSEGAINVSHADFAISISGIAGPDGATDDKPVGTVYIAARSKNELKIEHLSFHGDRNYIQEQSAYYAIKMLLQIDKKKFFK